MTGTKDLFNGIVDAIITKITTNKTALGIGGVEERAEDPAVMDKVRQYGSYCYVIPLAEGRDRMDNMQGSPGKEMYHNFSINVTSYFDSTSTILTADSLTSSLRATRDLAFGLIDLFNGDDNQVGKGFIYRFELEQGYYEIVDRIITTYNIKMYVKVLEN
jgi:hypothetical protein